MILPAHALRACGQQSGCENDAKLYCRPPHPVHEVILAERAEIAILRNNLLCNLDFAPALVPILPNRSFARGAQLWFVNPS